MKSVFKNDFTTFLMRISILYMVFFICRILFYVFNISIIDSITTEDIWGIIKGGFIFDSGSIFYLNIPFLLFSLIPLEVRSRKWYQNMLFWLFIVVNSIALFANIADVFYYEFKLGRMASDDFRYFGEGNAAELFVSFLKDYWYGFLLYFGLIALLAWGYKKIPYYTTIKKDWKIYYLGGIVLLSICGLLSIVLIRGGRISPATFPISMSDATLFVKNPSHSSLILSNPFCIIRTISGGIKYSKYFEEDNLDLIYPTTNQAGNSLLSIDSTTNIVLIILESFGSAHIGVLNGDDTPYTPFLDSLMNEGLLFSNAYHNGIRSIDALPSLWGSVPTFKKQFLSHPQSVSPMYALPAILKDKGYTTAFMHGAIRESMSFVAFSRKNGVEITYSQEDYEKERGHKDFDGAWGIWDDKFMDFAADKLVEMPKPTFSTIFTLSSHSPFKLPEDYKGKVVEGTMPIHKTVYYTDGVLREFFAKLSKEPFYDNTLFVITADHSSLGEREKFRKVPHSFSVPILFYKPNSNIKGDYTQVASHIDIMPTLLAMLGHDKPYFGFGRNLLPQSSDKNKHFTMNYFGGGFNIITDSTTYIFNENEIISTIGKPQEIDADVFNRAKAFIQQYYTHLENGDFLPEK